MKILGIHDGIDASACLLENGVLRYAIQEERMTGVKQQIGYPILSAKRVLKLAKLDISQIDEIALSTIQVLRSPGVEGHTGGMKVQLSLKEMVPTLFGFYEDLSPVIKKKLPGVESFLWFKKRWQDERIRTLRQKLGYYGPLTVVDHHTSHAASAFYSAPWRDELVLVLTSDAAGDGLCATVSIGENGLMTRIAETVHTESVGYLYSHITKYLGMKPHLMEYKVMGLAPWGAKGGEKSYDVLKRYIRLSEDGLVYKRGLPEPLHYIKPRLQSELYAHRFDNIAYGVQRVLEELLVAWVRNAVKKTGIHKVAFAGGAAMNVKANKLIREMPEVEGLFPMPSAGDESTSIGAAQWLYAQRMREQGMEPRVAPLGPLYLGDELTEREIEDAMDKETAMVGQFGPKKSFDAVRTSNVDALAADLIIKGEIVARCRGPMEFGARALGNRSILCDATDLRNVRRINTLIKSRDFWLPFAPVVLESRADELLKHPSYAPYMTMVFDTTEVGQHCLRAAMHQSDLTVRPQILRADWNPGYYNILHAYEMETGHGGMLNTSANITGEPIVHGGKEAFSMFLRSGLHNLVVGDYLLTKRGAVSKK